MRIKPAPTKADYERARRKIESMWGAKEATPQGNQLDVLATLVDLRAQASTHPCIRTHLSSDSLTVGAYTSLGLNWPSAETKFPEFSRPFVDSERVDLVSSSI